MLPDDGISCDAKHVGAILNILKYFIIILIVTTNYIFVHLLDNNVLLFVIGARYTYEEWSARTQSPLPTQQTPGTNIHALSGIRTRDSSNWAAVDLRLTPLGHRDGQRTQFCAADYEKLVFFNILFNDAVSCCAHTASAVGELRIRNIDGMTVKKGTRNTLQTSHLWLFHPWLWRHTRGACILWLIIWLHHESNNFSYFMAPRGL